MPKGFHPKKSSRMKRVAVTRKGKGGKRIKTHVWKAKDNAKKK